MAVVDRLEVVDVEEQAGQRVVVAHRLAEFDQAAVVEVAAVVHAGQAVGHAGAAKALTVEHALDRNGRDGGQPVQELGARASLVALGVARAQVQAADQQALADQRQQRRRAHGGAGFEGRQQQLRVGAGADQPRGAHRAVQRLQRAMPVEQARRLDHGQAGQGAPQFILGVDQPQLGRVQAEVGPAVHQQQIDQLFHRAHRDELALQRVEAVELALVGLGGLDQRLQLAAQLLDLVVGFG
mmetsp:Transcript_21620/g.51384  ORF Transcript_21620/g.51384 Transcript_21620/m.51384 type:complete len:240 (-) Transcript_21620:938-1657(-)